MRLKFKLTGVYYDLKTARIRQELDFPQGNPYISDSKEGSMIISGISLQINFCLRIEIQIYFPLTQSFLPVYNMSLNASE